MHNRFVKIFKYSICILSLIFASSLITHKILSMINLNSVEWRDIRYDDYDSFDALEFIYFTKSKRPIWIGKHNYKKITENHSIKVNAINIYYDLTPEQLVEIFKKCNKDTLKILSIGDPKMGNSILITNEVWEIIAQFKNLKFLKLQSRSKQPIPAYVFENLKNLKYFDNSGTEISKLPNDFFEKSDLRTLILSSRSIKNLPPEIGKLKKLRNLEISIKNLELLPSELENLQALKYLTVYAPLKKISMNSANMPNLKEFNLILTGKNLKEFPSGIENLKKLTYLKCTHVSIPSEIEKLQNLKKLELYYCNFSRLPKGICKLKNLRQLDLHFNGLQELPSEIRTLENLERLSITDDELTLVPKEIADMKKLNHLRLDSKKLTELPLEIQKKLINLPWVSIYHWRKIKNLIPELKSILFR